MKKRVLVASHRGHFGGNIVENTIPAFLNAIHCGADIVETDIHKTKDDRMILFHDETTERLLGLPGKVEDYTLEELRAQKLINVIGCRSDSGVNTLEELLDALKGKCMINLDQCWTFINDVYDVVEEKGMTEQALIKGRVPYKEVIEWVASRDYQPMFIPIITKDEEIEEFEKLPSQLKIPQVEVFATSDDDKVISEGFVKELNSRGIKLWVNSLTLGNGNDMSAGHDDNRSLTEDPDQGWGFLVRKGVEVIQTDWPMELCNYLESIGAR